MKTKFLSIIVAIVCALSLGSGCKTSAPDVAVKVSDTSKVTVEAALRAWDAYIVANHPPIKMQTDVRDAWLKYKQAQILVLDTAIILKEAESIGASSADAESALNKAMAETGVALADLINLLRQFNVKI